MNARTGKATVPEARRGPQWSSGVLAAALIAFASCRPVIEPAGENLTTGVWPFLSRHVRSPEFEVEEGREGTFTVKRWPSADSLLLLCKTYSEPTAYWTDRSVVRVEVEGGGETLALMDSPVSQHYFRSLSEGRDASRSDREWIVPLSYAKDQRPSQRAVEVELDPLPQQEVCFSSWFESNGENLHISYEVTIGDSSVAQLSLRKGWQ